MAKVHEDLKELGRQGALLFAGTNVERRALEAASDYLSNEESIIAFLFSGWCQTALPHKRLGDNEIWSLETAYVKLMIEPGSIHGPEGAIRVGVPFGSRARLILLYLQSEAIRTDSREIELGRSLRVWLGKLACLIQRHGRDSVAGSRKLLIVFTDWVLTPSIHTITPSHTRHVR